MDDILSQIDVLEAKLSMEPRVVANQLAALGSSAEREASPIVQARLLAVLARAYFVLTDFPSAAAVGVKLRHLANRSRHPESEARADYVEGTHSLLIGRAFEALTTARRRREWTEVSTIATADLGLLATRAALLLGQLEQAIDSMERIMMPAARRARNEPCLARATRIKLEVEQTCALYLSGVGCAWTDGARQGQQTGMELQQHLDVITELVREGNRLESKGSPQMRYWLDDATAFVAMLQGEYDFALSMYSAAGAAAEHIPSLAVFNDSAIATCNRVAGRPDLGLGRAVRAATTAPSIGAALAAPSFHCLALTLEATGDGRHAAVAYAKFLCAREHMLSPVPGPLEFGSFPVHSLPPSVMTNLPPPWWSDLLRRIDRQQDDALSVGQLAESVGVSERTVRDAFRAQLHCSPSRYLLQRRMYKLAVPLLSESELLVADVAHRIGYKSVSNFVRDFKRCFGSTPQAWRRERGLHDGTTDSACAATGTESTNRRTPDGRE